MATDPKIPKDVKFLLGSTAGCLATTVVHPAEVIKNRMQLSGMNGTNRLYLTTIQVFHCLITNEGFRSLYKGLSANMLRQVVYTGTRLNIYTWLVENWEHVHDRPPTYGTKALMAMFAGGCGAFVATPADVALVRTTADNHLAFFERRNYRNVFNALSRIIREEGLRKLWLGAAPTTLRAVVVNGAQLSTYSQAKQMLIESRYMKNNLHCHLSAATIAGFVAAIVSVPIDICKTRLQFMKPGCGRPCYRNSYDVVKNVLRTESVFSFWKGFTPYFLKLTPHTIIMLVTLEQLNALYVHYFDP